MTIGLIRYCEKPILLHLVKVRKSRQPAGLHDSDKSDRLEMKNILHPNQDLVRLGANAESHLSNSRYTLDYHSEYTDVQIHKHTDTHVCILSGSPA